MRHAGLDLMHAAKLVGAFQRKHSAGFASHLVEGEFNHP